MGKVLEGSEVIDIADAGERLYRSSRAMRVALAVMTITVAWLVSLTVLLLLAVFGPPDFTRFFSDVLLVTFAVLGFPLSLLNVAYLYLAFRDRGALSDFKSIFFPFWFRVKFGLLPRSQEKVEKEIWMRLTQTYSRRLGKRGVRVLLNEEVRGKTSERHFDVYASVPRRPGPLVSGHMVWYDTFVRILRNRELAGKEDVERFKHDVQDVLKANGHRPMVLLLASHAGFDHDAIEYASGENGLPTKNVTSCLLLVRPDRFEVVWVG